MCYHRSMMKRVLPFIITGIAAAWLLLSLVDFALAISPQRIYAGEPFVYWSAINRLSRPPLALVALALVSIWLFLRGFVRWLYAIPSAAVLLFCVACVVFALMTPLRSITQIAYHVQHLVEGDVRYHLYYQYEGIGEALPCEYVLVRCDYFGVQCVYVNRWDVAPICLAERANIALSMQAGQLVVTLNGDTIASY